MMDVIEVTPETMTLELVKVVEMGTGGLAAVAYSGLYADLLGVPVTPTPPTLAAVATSGEYADLLHPPFVPASASDVGAVPVTPGSRLMLDTEAAKLAAVAVEATKNLPDNTLLARSNHTGVQPISTVTGLQTALNLKVDAVAGKSLSSNDYTDEEKDKLAGLSNADLAELTGRVSAVEVGKVDKVNGKGLSDTNYTQTEKDKLATLAVVDLAPLTARVATVETGKVDKVAGKDLSDANFTAAEKTKLAGLANTDLTAVNASITALQSGKVDKDGAKVLSTNDYTSVEKTKLAGLSNFDPTAINAAVSALNSSKVDKDGVKVLSTNDYTTAEKNKLAGIAASATANSPDATLLARANHTGSQAISTVTGLQTALDAKVAVVPGFALSSNDYTSAEKTKLAGLTGSHYRGTFSTFSALGAGVATPVPGDYADVDTVGANAVRYVWDSSDSTWIAGSGEVTPVTAAQVKTLYESNANTNAYTDAEKTKLAGLANYNDSAVQASVTALQTNKVDKVAGKALSTNDYSDVEKTKVTDSVAYAARTTLQLVPKNRKLAILGDSIVAQNSNPTVGTENYGFLSQALRLADQRFTFDLAHNFGLGGDTTLQMQARIASVIASGAGTCIVAGGTNDRTGGLTAAETITNLQYTRDQLNAAGIFVILLTPAPRGDTTFTDKALTAVALGDHLTVRKWVLNQGLNYATVVVDLWTTLADPASTSAGIKLNYTHDGLHPLPLGAYFWGKPLAAAMCQVVDKDLSLLPTTNSDTYDAVNNPGGNVTVNPLFQGTGGTPSTGGSGVLGDGWSGTNAGAAAAVTRAYSKVTTATGDWQQVVIGGAAPTATAAVDLFRQISLQANVVAGQVYEAVGEFEIDAGCANLLSLQVGIVATNGAGTVTLWDGDRYNDTGTLSAEAQAGTFRSPRFIIPAGVTDVRLRVASYMGIVGAPVATIRVRKLAIIPARDTVPTGRRESYAAEIKQLFASFANKIDSVAGKGLSANDYTTAEKTKLAAIAAGATVNDTDANLKARANHTGTQAISTVTGLQVALDAKATIVDTGVGTATTYSSTKIEAINTALSSATTTAVTNYQTADADLNTRKVEKITGKGLSTEDYTTAEKTKLAGIAAGATVNSTDASLRDRSTHTGTQAQSTITGLVTAQTTQDDRLTATEGVANLAATNITALQSGKVDVVNGYGLSSNDYTSAEKTKLTGIATAATANATDANLRDRTTHTGAQAQSTVTGLVTALATLQTNIDGKVAVVAGKGLSTNDYTTVEKTKLAATRISGFDDLLVNATATGTVTLSLATVTAFDLTLTGNTTVAFSNVPVPSNQVFSWVVKIKQGAVAKTITWPTVTWYTADGLKPTDPVANKLQEYVFSTSDGSTIVGRKGAAT